MPVLPPACNTAASAAGWARPWRGKGQERKEAVEQTAEHYRGVGRGCGRRRRGAAMHRAAARDATAQDWRAAWRAGAASPGAAARADRPQRGLDPGAVDAARA